MKPPSKQELIDAMYLYYNWAGCKTEKWKEYTDKIEHKPDSEDWTYFKSYFHNNKLKLTVDGTINSIELGTCSKVKMNELRDKFIGFCLTELPEEMFYREQYDVIIETITKIRWARS